MLFVYIFKSSDYIFQIPFFIELREQIIELVKTKIDILYNDLKKGKNQDIIIKLNEVLSYFTNPDIYIEKYKKEQKEKNSQQSLNNPSIQGSGFSNKPSNNSNFGSSDSNANQGSSSLKNPFDNSSVKNRDPTDPFGLPIIDNEQDEKEKEQAYQILKKSKFSLDINYEKGQREANINYSSITYGEVENTDNSQTVEITDIKSIKADDEILNSNYEKFLQYLNQIEKDIKIKYKKEKKINIIITFSMTNDSLERSENYKINCNYNINDENRKGERDFTDEDFLNKVNYEGLSYMIDAL
jgi:phosphoribosylanthranilate isomerase